MSKEVQVASRSWGRREADSVLKPPEGAQACGNLDFRTSALQSHKTGNSILFVEICYSSCKELIWASAPGARQSTGLPAVTGTPGKGEGGPRQHHAVRLTLQGAPDPGLPRDKSSKPPVVFKPVCIGLSIYGN